MKKAPHTMAVVPSVQWKCSVCCERKTAYYCDECTQLNEEIVPICNPRSTKPEFTSCLDFHIHPSCDRTLSKKAI